MASIDQIISQLNAAGHPALPEGHPVADGKHHRYGPKKKYWYALHEVMRDGSVIGYTGGFGQWEGQDNNATKFEWQGSRVSAEDFAALRQRQAETERAEAEKKSVLAKNAAMRARQQWRDASIEGGSEYLDKKLVTPEAVRFDAEGCVLVPMVVYEDPSRLVGLQKISVSGAKRFNKGMDKAGAACRLGDVQALDRVAMIAEGYATGRSIRMATSEAIPLYVAFDAGSLLAVAKLVRNQYPDLHLLFCADDDWKLHQRVADFLDEEFGYTSGFGAGEVVVVENAKGKFSITVELNQDSNHVTFYEVTVTDDASKKSRTRLFENAGLKKAYEAVADLGNASVVVPRFADRGDRKLTDFNDLHVEEGLHVVKAQIESGLLAALAAPADEIPPFPHLHAVESVDDPLYDQAVEAVVKHNRASISNIQQVLRIGYNRAARLLERMEEARVVSSAGANGKRRVLGVDGTVDLASAAAARHDDQAEEENPANLWRRRLRRADKSGAILPALDNVFAVLANDPQWLGVLAFEEFSNRVMKLKRPPFDDGAAEGEWTDRDDARCVLWMGQRYGFSPRPDVMMEAVFLVADRNRYHVVHDYLNTVQPEWDREQRLGLWLTKYLGVVDTEYSRLVGFKWLLGAIGRVMKPGCKMDNVLILEGAQDAGKSAAFRVLFTQQWFTDANITIGDKDTFSVIAGKWVIELAELDALNKADSSLAKKFFTTAVDTYRPPYAKRAIDVPRQSVFAGTVNFDTYLKDESGNRRYWPVKTALTLDLAGLLRDRDQIWAEAYTAYTEWEKANAEAGGNLPTPWQVLPGEKHLFSAEQEARYEGDIYETMIARHLVGLSRVTMEELLGDCLKLEISKWTPAEQRRIGKALKSIGWVRKRETTGAREWYYTPPEAIPAQIAEYCNIIASDDDDAPL